MSTIILTLDVCSLLYIILLLVVYYSKKRIKSFETTIFGILIFIAMLSTITEFIEVILTSFDYKQDTILIYIVCSLYIYSYLVIYLLLLTFTLTKNFTFKESDSTKINKYFKKALLINLLISVFAILVTLCAVIFNLTTSVIETGSYYGDGIGVLFIIIFSASNSLYMLYSVIKNRNKLTTKEKIFYISVIALQSLSGIIRVILPALMVNNIINTFMISIMFFTIENPDIKIINKLEVANEEKSKFLSSMSHEMKTPLNAILGLSSVGETDNLKNINKEANILSDIINNIMDSNSFDIKTIRSFKESFNIKSALSSVIDETKNSIAGKHIIFNANIPDVMIISNSEAIVSLCDRLLSNAYKFTDRGFITFNITLDNNKLNINIKDSGKGIPNDKLESIINRFNSKNDNNIIPGLGLGLSLVKLTVDALYGTIDIKSEVDEGTEVIVTIPIEKV